MYAPYPENMMESIKKVEATRAQRMATEPRRLTADEKDALLKKFHPDYNPDAFAEIKVGANKGQKAPLQLAEMLHSTSRLIKDKVDITKVDYDVDVLVIGAGGAGSSAAIVCSLVDRIERKACDIHAVFYLCLTCQTGFQLILSFDSVDGRTCTAESVTASASAF